MPLYNYTCPKCGAKIERIVKLSKRDIQMCNNILGYTDVQPVIEAHTRQQFFEGLPMVCAAVLKREEIALTAKMHDSWKP